MAVTCMALYYDPFSASTWVNLAHVLSEPNVRNVSVAVKVIPNSLSLVLCILYKTHGADLWMLVGVRKNT